MKSARRTAQNAVTSQSRPYIHFDEREDVISSLELLGSLVSNVDKSPRDWKWCIIAAHSALQGALVCILSGTAEIGAMREDLQSAWLEWFDNRKGKEPDTKLADFKTLLKWAGNSSRMVHADEGPPLKLSATQIRDLHKLHYFRNQFAHYAPMGWAIEKAGLPRIVLTASDTAEHLMLSYFRLRMHLLEIRSGESSVPQRQSALPLGNAAAIRYALRAEQILQYWCLSVLVGILGSPGPLGAEASSEPDNGAAGGRPTRSRGGGGAHFSD
jgi:hypothetical protein